MAFDTETTGLFPKAYDCIDTYPHITQLSFVIYDDSTNRIVQIYNSYVKIPSDFKYNEYIIEKITGITREKCERYGQNIEVVLQEFYKAYQSVDKVVAHNIAFDKRVITTEMARNIHILGEDVLNLFDPNSNKDECTMTMSKKKCNLYTANKYGGMFLKNPKLCELYRHLFEIDPTNLHNALMDTIYCLRCYLKLKYNILIPDTEFEALVEQSIQSENEIPVYNHAESECKPETESESDTNKPTHHIVLKTKSTTKSKPVATKSKPVATKSKPVATKSTRIVVKHKMVLRSSVRK